MKEPSPTIVPAAAKTEPASRQARSSPKKANERAKPAVRGKLSGLDAAAQVLAQAKEPLRCTDLTARVLSKGLWKTKGKTPAATLNAAMLREIKTKGSAARFRKAGRGLFAAKG